MTIELVRHARSEGKWFYFPRTKGWLAPIQVERRLRSGWEMEYYKLRSPVHMLIMYKQLQDE